MKVVLESESQPGGDGDSPEDIRFIVEEARAAGLKVAAHAWTTAGVHNAVAGGVASVEHVNGITDEEIAAVEKGGITLVFTPFPEWVLREPGLSAEAAVKNKPAARP